MGRMKEKQIKVMWTATVILTGIALAVTYLTHRAVPFMMDDLWYSTLLYEETPIHSLGDIVRAQIWHYNNWGGRSITHGLLQMILLAGEQFADVANVAATIVLAWVVCLVSGYRSLYAFLGAVCVMTGCNANWKMSMFWQAGAANYLYITSVLLLFLYCYLGNAEGAQTGKVSAFRSIGSCIGILLLGFISGWSNENMGPSLWVITGVILLVRRKHKQTIKAWMVLGNLACLAGSILVVIAPGNFVRSKEAENGYGLWWNLFLRGYAESKAALEFLFPVLLVFFGILICYKALGLALGYQNRLLLGCAVLSWGAMVLSPHYPDRATFGTMILLLCVILAMVKEIVRECPKVRWYLWAGMVFLWFRAMYVMGEFLAITWGWIK